MILIIIMEITAKEQEIFANIRQELANSKKTLFFFHDDPDGICSFLQMNQYAKTSYGVIVKSKPILDEKFFAKIDSYQPDLVMTLDLAIVKQEFIDHCNEQGIKVVIVDHHEINDIKDYTQYYNPKMFHEGDVTANSSLCYYILEQPKELMWLAALGTVADWQLPKFYNMVTAQFPDLTNSFSAHDLMKICDYKKSESKVELLDKALKKAAKKYDKKSVEFLLFNTKLGLLAKIFSFCVKGDMRQVKRNISALMKIKDYDDLLERKSSPSKLVYRTFTKYITKYLDLLLDGLSKVKNEKILVYTYKERDSYSGELANELYYFNPDKFVLVGRLKDHIYRISMRYKGNALEIFKNSSEGLECQGGGHVNACGASINEKDFDLFVRRIKKQL